MPAYYTFLTLLTRLTTPRLVVELGTDRGYSALAFALGGAVRVVSLDIDPTPRDPRIDHPSLEFRLMNSLPPPNDLHNIELLFIDTDGLDKTHIGSRAAAEYHAYLPQMAPHALILFDDIYINDTMRMMWESLPARHKFSLHELHAPFGMGCVLLP